MNVGFTGTREGMTGWQEAHLAFTLQVIQVADSHTETEFFPQFHHGDCVGADAEADKIVRGIGGFWRIIHPPIEEYHRAHCPVTVDSTLLEPEEYLVRNKDIVDQTDWLIAAPKTKKRFVRSGTWSTVRYAESQGKRVLILHRDGTFEWLPGEVDRSVPT